MDKPSLIDDFRDFLASKVFDLFLWLSNTTKERYYSQWIGYTQEEHNNFMNSPTQSGEIKNLKKV